MEEEFADCAESVDEFDADQNKKPPLSAARYYAVAFTSDSRGRRRGCVEISQADAQRRLKGHPGGRFKIFKEYAAARQFADTPAELFSPIRTVSKAREDTDLYSSVSQRELNLFKSAILVNDGQKVSTMLWNNPRYLINLYDGPTHMHPRLRYNALHEICSRGHHNLLRLLLQIMTGQEIWRRINKNLSEHALQNRRYQFLDMFLNGRENGLGETPLHFAFKFGHVLCARALLTHPQTEPWLCNHEGHTPDDLAGSRMVSGEGQKRARIVELRALLREQYVALLTAASEYEFTNIDKSPPQVIRALNRSAESALPCVAAPLRWCELQPLIQRSQMLAYAGPLSPERATEFYQLWAKPGRPGLNQSLPSCPTDAVNKLLDPDKGFEAVGRRLAFDFKVPWREKWAFLGEGVFTDLGQIEGLDMLERHISSVEKQMSVEKDILMAVPRMNGLSLDESAISDDGERLSGDGHSSSSLSNESAKADSLSDSFLDKFASLHLKSPSTAASSSSSSSLKSNNAPQQICCSTPIRKLNGMTSSPEKPSTPPSSTPIRRLQHTRNCVESPGTPRRLDRQVLTALKRSPADLLTRYPRVRLWMEEVQREPVAGSPLSVSVSFDLSRSLVHCGPEQSVIGAAGSDSDSEEYFSS